MPSCGRSWSHSRQLRRRRPKGGQRSLREISAELAARGFMNERGDAFSAASISSMLAGQQKSDDVLSRLGPTNA
jgi:hypothetical protein